MTPAEPRGDKKGDIEWVIRRCPCPSSETRYAAKPVWIQASSVMPVKNCCRCQSLFFSKHHPDVISCSSTHANSIGCPRACSRFLFCGYSAPSQENRSYTTQHNTDYNPSTVTILPFPHGLRKKKKSYFFLSVLCTNLPEIKVKVFYPCLLLHYVIF